MPTLPNADLLASQIDAGLLNEGWLKKRRELLAITRPGPEHDALTAEIVEAEARLVTESDARVAKLALEKKGFRKYEGKPWTRRVKDAKTGQEVTRKYESTAAALRAAKLAE